MEMGRINFENFDPQKRVFTLCLSESLLNNLFVNIPAKMFYIFFM